MAETRSDRLQDANAILLSALREIRSHLYVAAIQRSVSDDKIIAGHIDEAHNIADEAISNAERIK